MQVEELLQKKPFREVCNRIQGKEWCLTTNKRMNGPGVECPIEMSLKCPREGGGERKEFVLELMTRKSFPFSSSFWLRIKLGQSQNLIPLPPVQFLVSFIL